MRGRGLFAKYVLVLVGLVTAALLVSGAAEVYFSYRENQAALVALQREKAAAAAIRIEQFVREIERQLGWTTHPLMTTGPVALEQRRLDFFRLLRQVPAITEVAHLDPAGREQLRVSRLAMDVRGAGTDRSHDPAFREAARGRTWLGPVYFRRESEPYMTLAVAASGGGVTVAEVNLKLIWDVVTQIRIGHAGRAYVVDGRGQLVAHPDISLVLKKTDLSALPQVAAAVRGAREPPSIATDLDGHRVLTAAAAVPGVGWTVLAEQPLGEAFEPVRASLLRTVVVALLGVAGAVAVALVLARRMVRPIRELATGAARIGAGDLGHRLAIRTGDEIEALAEQFNVMAAQLQESYAGLERTVEERTAELRDALEQQTATAEVLKVISRSALDLPLVLETLVESATRLCGATRGHIFRYDGEVLRFAAAHGAWPGFIEYLEQHPTRPGRGSVAGRAALERRPVHVVDVLAEPEYEYSELVAHQDYRAVLAVPLLRGDTLLGVIAILKPRPEPFTDKEIALLQTFADQAVIAIENVRLFQELEARNRELTEALEQQTATAEILRVISGSPTDVQPVLDVVAQNAARLCEARDAVVLRVEGQALRVVAHYGPIPARALDLTMEVTPDWMAGRAVLERRTIHVPDLAAALDEYPRSRPLQERSGQRTTLVVPMLREGVPIGVIVLRRPEVRPFSERHIALVQTFADQAVIAIENVRLFQELQERTRALARSVEELKALGAVSQAVNSTLELETVLSTILAHADTLAGADGGVLYEYDDAGGRFVMRATRGFEPAVVEVLQATPPRLGEGAAGRAVADRAPVEIPDIREDPAYPRDLRQVIGGTGIRAVLAVPLEREQRVLGCLVLARKTPGGFPAEVVGLLRTMAAQSALAIQNARLFRELEQKSRELEAANRHKSEFLANMSHELRTPLNAIIGFSEVLLERMFGDVNPKQEEYLQDIVASGRHLLYLINDILDLSKVEAGRMDLELTAFDLRLALENALTLIRERAARHGLSVGLHVEPGVGEIVGDERKVKQVLLNLLSNAVKFTPPGGRIDVRAGPVEGAVEVAVTDTGIGIAPEDQEAIFEEFRQVGADEARKREGTGLGLTLVRKLVELHGGRLRVESEPGRGSTFTFTLPRRPADGR